MSTTEGIGATLSLNAQAPATYDAAGYAALTFVDVEQAGDIPEFGPEHATTTFTPLKTGITGKGHGPLDYGSFTLPGALDSEDAGQDILVDALASKAEISARQRLPDGTVRYFSVKVMSFRSGASVGSVTMFSSKIEVTRETIAGT